jgi:hypothetical protein
MAKAGEERSQDIDGTDLKNRLETTLSEYGKSAEAFAYGLKRSSTGYDLMLVKQIYLLDTAAVIRSTSEIFDYQDISSEATIFGSDAWAYLNNSDLQAFQQQLDNRFVLSKDWSHFLRCRLEAAAKAANRIEALFSKELQDTENSELSALRFLLDVVLELPIGAWENATCFAMNGNCRDCGYGRDHGICSIPGSNYWILNNSCELMLKDIRKNLTRNRRTSRAENLKQEQKAHFSSDKDEQASSQTEIDIFGEYDLVEVCD